MKDSITDLIVSGMHWHPNLVAALAKALDSDAPSWTEDNSPGLNAAKRIEAQLIEAGSHTFGSNKRYGTVAKDVAEKLELKVAETATDEEVETEVLKRLFAQAWDRMSPQERKNTAAGLKYDGSIHVDGVKLAAVIVAGRLGGFATYQVAVIVANAVARAIFGAGISFAGNALLTRGLGVLLGPVGWIASGIWLAYGLSGPAYRKTVPAVVMIAAIRSALRYDYCIGVVGDGSTGKDCLMREVFEINTNNVGAVAGSTREAARYELPGSAIHVVNFPGFLDINPQRDEMTQRTLASCRSFFAVIDASRGINKNDIDLVENLKQRAQQGKGEGEIGVIVCLNKWDIVRERDRAAIRKAAEVRLGCFRYDPHALSVVGGPSSARHGRVEYVETAFEPITMNPENAKLQRDSRDDVRSWLCRYLSTVGVKAPSFCQERVSA